MRELIEETRKGSRRAIARLITHIENNSELAREAIAALYGSTGRAQVIGVTGPPGSGKSTLVNEITKIMRASDRRVGIVAVDPSSPFSGGALLGDRVRMRDLSGDAGIFIRSMASRGSLGGLARTTADVVKVLDAAGYDRILVETVGAGQAEVEIAGTAHTTLVIEAPGMGDDVQTIKAGILEIADILVVNKADRPGASNTVNALKSMLHMGRAIGSVRHHGRIVQTSAPSEKTENMDEAWQVPVLATIAPKAEGVRDVVQAIEEHRQHLRDSGEWEHREKERSRREVDQLLRARFMDRFAASVPDSRREKVIDAVAARELDPYSAVDQLIEWT